MPKISKEAAGYVEFKGSDYQCRECYKFEPAEGKKNCAEVEGTIEPFGGCNEFVQGQPSQIAAISLPRKLTQGEAGYAESKVGFGCRRCKEFDPQSWDCEIVDKNSDGPTKGYISPQACCNHWKKDPIRGIIQ